MSSSSLSSSTSLSLVSSPSTAFPVTASSSEKINPLPLMENLFSALGGSNAEVHGELRDTSLVIYEFIRLTNERFQDLALQKADQEASVIANRAQLLTTEKMHIAQMQAMQKLTETVERVATQLNDRLEALENKILLTNKRINQLEEILAPEIYSGPVCLDNFHP